MQQIKASEETLDKIFSSDYDFEIPNYQRAYAWRTEETLELLEDLAAALDGGGDEPYFLGSIVLVQQIGDTAAKVIDGQQRLTTLTILLAVLRDLSVGDAPRATALSTRVVEPGDPIMQRTPKPRLLLRERDQPFFRRWVQQSGAIAGLLGVKDDGLVGEAQHNIRSNACALHRALSQWPQERRNELATMLLARTFLVTVRTQDLRSAHRIFSVMNSRGLDLTAPDIFKSDVIGAIPDQVSDEYTKRWEDAEEEVGRSGFEEMFLHLRLIFAKERAKQSLLTEFPVQVLHRYLPERAKEFVDEVIGPSAHAFAQINRAAYSSVSGADKVNRWLRWLGRLDTTDWQAPALWALRRRGDDPEWLEAFLRRLERLAASMYVRRVYLTPRISRYVELISQLDEGADLDAPAFGLTVEERQETRLRLDGDVYLTTKTRRYILERLDEVLANSSGATYDHKIITVEHVLPQNPRSDSRWVRDFSEGERLAWTHRLANLVLLNQAKNAQARNYDFDDKKQRYFASRLGTTTFALTSQVLNQQAWTPHVLEQRQTTLLASLVNEWGLAAVN